jgi:hypothetical protein
MKNFDNWNELGAQSIFTLELTCLPAVWNHLKHRFPGFREWREASQVWGLREEIFERPLS